MATRKAKPAARGDAPPDAPSNADTLDFDAWAARVRADAGSLLPFVWVAESGADGRSFGSRLGKVPLVPLDDLDERCRTEWPGPRMLVLRTKRAQGGTIAHTGRLALAGDSKAAAHAAPSGDTATLAALVLSLQRQVADLAAKTTAAPAAPPLSDQVGALASVAQVVRALTPAATDAAAKAGLSLDDVRALLDLGKRSAGDTSLGLEALRMLGPAGVDFLKASAGLLLLKMNKANDGGSDE